MAQRGGSFDEELVGLFDLSHDAFCIAGFDGYLRRANPAFARSLGYTLEELLARPFMDNVYPDDVESVETVLAELAAGKDIVGFECREVSSAARVATRRRAPNSALAIRRSVTSLATPYTMPASGRLLVLPPQGEWVWGQTCSEV